MDACSDQETNRVVMMFASQSAKSECCLNVAGYYIDYDPSPMLIIQPTVQLAEAFSKERFAPMLADTPSLAALVSDAKSRDTSNTILRKEFPGGFTVLIGANAPSGLASRPIRILIADEVDRFPMSAGTEGDPVSLADKRLTTFWNSRTLVCSTPTVKDESRIESEYLNSTQEVWQVPCPSCGQHQVYEWPRLRFADESNPEPLMACLKCGAMHSEYEWKAETGRWFAQAEHPTTRGFHLNALASPWITWGDLVAEFKAAKAGGPDTLKVFINTRLAECWEEEGEALDQEKLEAHQHYYNADVPLGVRVLTVGVDVQQNRVEVEVVGWGSGKQSWGIEYRVIAGDPHHAIVWRELDDLLQRNWQRADGALLPISCTAIDSGYATTHVYAFCRSRAARYVFAVKGMGGQGLPIVGPYKRQGKNKDTALFPVGADATKDLILTRLNVEAEGPGYCHYPAETYSDDGERVRGYGREYFAGLTSERRVERIHLGKKYHTWVKKYGAVRNEPLDCRVYATAALEIRNPDLSPIQRQATPVIMTSRGPAKRRAINKGIEL
jgi:phage terminase large subunit GpA-like protein